MHEIYQNKDRKISAWKFLKMSISLNFGKNVWKIAELREMQRSDRVERERKKYESISLYSIRMRGNTDEKKLRIWTLFTQCTILHYEILSLLRTLLQWALNWRLTTCPLNNNTKILLPTADVLVSNTSAVKILLAPKPQHVFITQITADELKSGSC